MEGAESSAELATAAAAADGEQELNEEGGGEQWDGWSVAELFTLCPRPSPLPFPFFSLSTIASAPGSTYLAVGRTALDSLLLVHRDPPWYQRQNISKCP